MQSLATNYFELFGITPRFKIDMQKLESTFRRLQSEMHPDRYSKHTETEKRLALQHSAKLNDGYRALRSPTSRAKCLIDLATSSPEATTQQTASTLSNSFLMAQMEWREAIEEARTSNNASVLDALSRRLRHKISQQETALTEALDEKKDMKNALQYVNELSFYEKLCEEINNALDKMDA